MAKSLFVAVGPTVTATLRITVAALVLCALVRPRVRTLSRRQ